MLFFGLSSWGGALGGMGSSRGIGEFLFWKVHFSPLGGRSPSVLHFWAFSNILIIFPHLLDVCMFPGISIYEITLNNSHFAQQCTIAQIVSESRNELLFITSLWFPSGTCPSFLLHDALSTCVAGNHFRRLQKSEEIRETNHSEERQPYCGLIRDEFEKHGMMHGRRWFSTKQLMPKALYEAFNRKERILYLASKPKLADH